MQIPTTNQVDTFGSGADGAITVTTSQNLNTTAIASGRQYADGIAYKLATPPTSGITEANTVDTINGISAGDEVLLINLQGATADYAAVGTYEFLTVKEVAGKP